MTSKTIRLRFTNSSKEFNRSSVHATVKEALRQREQVLKGEAVFNPLETLALILLEDSAMHYGVPLSELAKAGLNEKGE